MDYSTILINRINKRKIEINGINLILKDNSQLISEILNQILIDNDLKLEDLSTPTQKINNNIDNPPSNDFLTKLYKTLALKAHPDKNNNQDKDFIDIKEAYQNENITDLLFYSKKYELPEIIFDGNVLLLLQKEYININNKLINCKSSIGYKLLIEGNIDSHIELIKYRKSLKKIE
jgi:hypothetical protein